MSLTVRMPSSPPFLARFVDGLEGHFFVVSFFSQFFFPRLFFPCWCDPQRGFLASFGGAGLFFFFISFKSPPSSRHRVVPPDGIATPKVGMFGVISPSPFVEICLPPRDQEPFLLQPWSSEVGLSFLGRSPTASKLP